MFEEVKKIKEIRKELFNKVDNLSGIYSISNLPETTRDSSPLVKGDLRFVIKRRSEEKIKSGQYPYFMFFTSKGQFDYMTSLIPIKDKENVYDLDLLASKSPSGKNEFYRMHVNLDKGIADITLKTPIQ